MFQAPGIGMLEWVLIAIIALVVVGPKDLPLMFRKAGQFVGRLRNMAAEFRRSFDEIARQSELDELRREVDALRADARDMKRVMTGPLHEPLRPLPTAPIHTDEAPETAPDGDAPKVEAAPGPPEDGPSQAPAQPEGAVAQGVAR